MIAYIPILAFLAMTDLGGSKRKRAEVTTKRKAGFIEPPRGRQPMVIYPNATKSTPAYQAVLD
jgi:hypothetical protein